MTVNQVKKVVIVGGGTAGWLAAAALGHQLGELLEIVLVESDEIATVGVGEASIPPMRIFHKLLRIDEQEFMRATEATFKLGIGFENWGKLGESYIHSFGKNGKETWLADFHHFWLHSVSRGMVSELGDYCFELQAAKAGKFATSSTSTINFAYHLDASLYAKFLQKFAQGNGVVRIEGRVEQVQQDSTSGYIQSITIASGQTIKGDLFIDCSGFRGLLIEQSLHSGYQDWSHWLPCDRAVALQTEAVYATRPYTRAIAHAAGWQWQIPLQHRVGNGLVYCSRYMSDDEASAKLLSNIEGNTLTEPRIIRFRTGRCLQAWNKNCVALGLASGFVEPLESTSIHLVMMGITRLMQLFPFGGVNQPLIERFNYQTQVELEKIRDFIVLHYHATERRDSQFWRHCRTMTIPDSLAHRIEVFKECAHAFQADGELFRVDSWVQVMLGQGIKPNHYHHFAKLMNDNELGRFLGGLKADINSALEKLPTHQSFLQNYCSK